MSKKCVKCGHPLPGGRFFLSTLHGNSSGKRGDQGAEAVEKEGFCDWSSTGVSGRCGLCFFFVP